VTTRFGIPLAAWLVGLSGATFLSVVGGIIVGAVHGAWAWLGVPVFFGVLMAAEIYAGVRRERRDMALEELVGPLPARDEIDMALLDRHLRAWSREN
jgi:hypothetical protein